MVKSFLIGHITVTHWLEIPNVPKWLRNAIDFVVKQTSTQVELDFKVSTYQGPRRSGAHSSLSDAWDFSMSKASTQYDISMFFNNFQRSRSMYLGSSSVVAADT